MSRVVLLIPSFSQTSIQRSLARNNAPSVKYVQAVGQCSGLSFVRARECPESTTTSVLGGGDGSSRQHTECLCDSPDRTDRKTVFNSDYRDHRGDSGRSTQRHPSSSSELRAPQVCPALSVFFRAGRRVQTAGGLRQLQSVNHSVVVFELADGWSVNDSRRFVLRYLSNRVPRPNWSPVRTG